VGRWRSCGWSCGHTRSSSTGPRCPPSPSTVHPPVTPTSSPVCPPVLHRIRARWDGLGGGLGGHSEQLPPSNPQSYPQAVGEYHPSSPIYLVLGVLHRSERPRPGGHDQTCSGTCVQLPADAARSGTPSLIDGEDLACDPPPDWRSVGRSSPPNPTGCGQPLGMTTLGGPRSCGPSLADLTGHRSRIPDRTGEATVDLGRAAARRPGSFQTFENVPNTASWRAAPASALRPACPFCSRLVVDPLPSVRTLGPTRGRPLSGSAVRRRDSARATLPRQRRARPPYRWRVSARMRLVSSVTWL